MKLIPAEDSRPVTTEMREAVQGSCRVVACLDFIGIQRGDASFQHQLGQFHDLSVRIDDVQVAPVFRQGIGDLAVGRDSRRLEHARRDERPRLEADVFPGPAKVNVDLREDLFEAPAHEIGDGVGHLGDKRGVLTARDTERSWTPKCLGKAPP